MIPDLSTRIVSENGIITLNFYHNLACDHESSEISPYLSPRLTSENETIIINFDITPTIKYDPETGLDSKCSMVLFYRITIV